MQQASSVYTDTKPHYELLDGLRGVAALVVIWFHIFEGFATSPFDQGVNHGYLAVDFFFILSGFVVAYAYDDRWKRTLSLGNFFKRRLIRLHPMVILGVILGVFTYSLQGSERWDHTVVPFTSVLLAMLLNLFLIPIVPGSNLDVRGNNEMFPLNGPHWSLFFEYIGNILYALVIRHLSTLCLGILVFLAGCGICTFAIGNYSGFGHLGVGWSMIDNNLWGGFLRMLFAFSAGLLMSRLFTPWKSIRGAFWVCSLAIIALLCVPYVGSQDAPWVNGIYDSICVIFLFPLIVWVAASGKAIHPVSVKVCRFLGDISFPIYAIHYPFAYLFYAWLWKSEEKVPFSEAWPYALLLFFGSIILTWIVLKFYDLPVRKWLSQRFLSHNKFK